MYIAEFSLPPSRERINSGFGDGKEVTKLKKKKNEYLKRCNTDRQSDRQNEKERESETDRLTNR